MWNFAQSALPVDRKARNNVTVLATVRRTHGLPPLQNQALLPEHVVALLDLLPSLESRRLARWFGLARIFEDGVLFSLRGNRAGARSDPKASTTAVVKRLAVTDGVRGNLSEGDREENFSGHSRRAGLASSAEIGERYVQKHLGHASAEMTKAAGL